MTHGGPFRPRTFCDSVIFIRKVHGKAASWATRHTGHRDLSRPEDFTKLASESTAGKHALHPRVARAAGRTTYPCCALVNPLKPVRVFLHYTGIVTVDCCDNKQYL